MVRILIAATCIGSLFVPAAGAGIDVAPGWQNAVVPAAPAAAFTSGLAILQNGDAALFDGTSVVAVDPATGTVTQTLFTPPAPVFGSFVAADPTGTFLLFGESSNGTITRIPLDGSAAAVVTTIAFNFDCAFSPGGAAFVSASPSSFSATEVLHIDRATGATDLIAALPGPSGALVFDAAGDLYYAEASPSFPAPIGQQSVWRFTAAQLAGAFGPTHLTDADAQTFVPAITAVADMVFDGEGDLLYCDSVDGSLREFAPNGLLKGVIGHEPSPGGITAVAWHAGPGPAVFGAYQPTGGGTLLAVSSDFFSYNDLNVVVPERIGFTVQPANPVPVGPLAVSLQAGPPSGMVLLLIAANTLPPYTLHGSGTPFLLEIDPTVMVVAFVPLDGNGDLTIPSNNPGFATTLAIQGCLFDTVVGPLASTELLSLTLQ